MSRRKKSYSLLRVRFFILLFESIAKMAIFLWKTHHFFIMCGKMDKTLDIQGAFNRKITNLVIKFTFNIDSE